MLVLTRDLKDSTLLIGDDIEIKVVNVKGNQVRLAINAPDDVNIVRTELLDPQEQPADLPKASLKPNADKKKEERPKPSKPSNEAKQRKAHRGAHQGDVDGNRRSTAPQGRRSTRGYRDPRQLTPSHAVSAKKDDFEQKPEKVPVISLKRRRRVASKEDSPGEDS